MEELFRIGNSDRAWRMERYPGYPVNRMNLVLTGGFGACVLEACNDNGLETQGIRRLGLPDRWIYQGGRGDQLAEAGIDADGIARTVREALTHLRSRRLAGGSRAS